MPEKVPRRNHAMRKLNSYIEVTGLGTKKYCQEHLDSSFFSVDELIHRFGVLPKRAAQFRKSFLCTYRETCVMCQEIATKKPVVINLDLIRTMKIEGKFEEAEGLIKAYHDNLRKMRKTNKQEVATNYNKIRVHKLMQQGKCINCSKKVIEGKALCKPCNEKKTISYNISYAKKKAKAKKNNSCICGGKKVKGFQSCQRCKLRNRQYAMNRAKTNMMLGFCRCGRELYQEYKQCQVCMTRRRNNDAKRRARKNKLKYQIPVLSGKPVYGDITVELD